MRRKRRRRKVEEEGEEENIRLDEDRELYQQLKRLKRIYGE